MALARYLLRITLVNYDGLEYGTAEHVANRIGAKIISVKGALQLDNRYFAYLDVSCVNMEHVRFICKALRRLQRGKPEFELDAINLWRYDHSRSPSDSTYMGSMLVRGDSPGNRVALEPDIF